ncbi:MAG TPA: plasma-membrane proton-efflux P-type ATPase [Euryarchaeota archaeon]|nr:calcium-transporting ATPase [archaeon BMS3Bbin15]HDL15424.1 plasma-membrane proton-efflux P-type ATPase [Euryarchaeota archaeon]
MTPDPDLYAPIVDLHEAEKSDIKTLFKKLNTSTQGISNQEAEKRIKIYGPNALQEKRVNPILKFLSYFWGPIPWMIEIAAVLSVLSRDIDTFIIIFAMLLINGLIGFFEEHQASNAMEALKKQLANEARALRDNKWQEIEASNLVPGDIVHVKLGDVIAADIKLIEGKYLSVDQSAMTGESLPVTKKGGDVAYSGSIIKQGEMTALVTATGINTYLGKTAKLVQSAGAPSHFQETIMRIGDFLIIAALVFGGILISVELLRGIELFKLLTFVLVLIVASIPVAMPAVLSVTLAMGAMDLARVKALVTKLQSIEEMAGVDVLCSDKTGTLTQNKIKVGERFTFKARNDSELLITAALASDPDNGDTIDLAVLNALQDKIAMQDNQQLEFTPFDPISKKMEATIQDVSGNRFKVSKGAPQVIMEMCKLDKKESTRVNQIIEDQASKGYRTLGVAKKSDNDNWQFMGILSLYDPPREDSKATIAAAESYGLRVKMITGDHIAIAKQIAAQLGLGTNIVSADEIFNGSSDTETSMQKIEKADGFAQVFPEHKYQIVKALQSMGHYVAMTGDGVNDAPALKQADVGIAVPGATSAARAAAALVLTGHGLSTIIKAIEKARHIFQRMLSYVIYRITMTLDIMVFVVLAMIIFNMFPLTAKMIVLLALMDDIPIMAIATDHTYISSKPVRWKMKKVLASSGMLGMLALIETFGLFLLIWYKAPDLFTYSIRTIMFLQLIASGHLMLFVTRTEKFFWQKPYPSRLLFLAIIITQILAAIMAGLGLLMPAISWNVIALIWGYNVIWVFGIGIINGLVNKHWKSQYNIEQV